MRRVLTNNGTYISFIRKWICGTKHGTKTNWTHYLLKIILQHHIESFTFKFLCNYSVAQFVLSHRSMRQGPDKCQLFKHLKM